MPAKGEAVDDLLKVELLKVALDAGREVGEELARVRAEGVPEAETKTSRTDMVSTMDLWAEKRLVERLLEARPDDGVIGEEGTALAGTSGVQWCLDPIDGTTNYLYDHPGYSISMAALVEGEPVVAVVVDPSLEQVFTAVAGHGAWRDNRPIAASSVDDLSVALAGTGFAYDATRRGRQAEVLAKVIPHVRDIRRMGGAALDLCSVGCARLDVFYERGLNLWDVVAGGLVAREAGARVTDLEGNDTWSGMVVAAPPALHEPLLELLRSAGAGTA